MAAGQAMGGSGAAVRPARARPATRACVIAAAYLLLVLAGFARYSYRKGSCAEYLETARALQQHYGLAPRTCLQYFLGDFLIPGVLAVLPFVSYVAVLLYKERSGALAAADSAQERLAFRLTAVSMALLLAVTGLLATAKCEGFGCLGVGALAGVVLLSFPPVIYALSLWFLHARYAWSGREFPAVLLIAILLFTVGFAQVLP